MSQTAVIFSPQSQPDVIIGKIESGIILPDEISPNGRLRNFEVWNEGTASFYNWSGGQILEITSSGINIVGEVNVTGSINVSQDIDVSGNINVTQNIDVVQTVTANVVCATSFCDIPYTTLSGFVTNPYLSGLADGSISPPDGEGGGGFTGSVGFTGSQGIAGTNGFTGSVGFTGSQGIAGTNGFTGSVGFTGSQGIAGTNGFTGSQGFTGSSGTSLISSFTNGADNRVLTATSSTGINGETNLTYDGTTLNLNDTILLRPVIRDYAESLGTPTISSNILTLDLETANIFRVSLNQNVNTFNLNNAPSSGLAGSFTLIIDITGNFNITWPGSIRWVTGNAPTLTTTAGKIDMITFMTTNGGIEWLAFVVAQNF